MGRNAKQVPSSERKDPPALETDSYPARVVGIVFLGVQKQRPFNNQPKKPVEEVQITYELSHEFMATEGGEPDETKPRWISERIPFYSLSVERAKSTRRYNAIDPSDSADGDFSKLLGMPATVFIVKEPGRGKNEGRVFNNIGEVNAATKIPGYVQPELVNDPFYFDPYDNECTVEEFRSRPEYIQKVIKDADNFSESFLYSGDMKEPETNDEDEDNPYAS